MVSSDVSPVSSFLAFSGCLSQLIVLSVAVEYLPSDGHDSLYALFAVRNCSKDMYSSEYEAFSISYILIIDALLEEHVFCDALLFNAKYEGILIAIKIIIIVITTVISTNVNPCFFVSKSIVILFLLSLIIL